MVTGGAGFIGSNLVRYLLDRGYNVVTLDKLTYAGNTASLVDLPREENHFIVHGDIGDRPFVRALLEEFRPGAVLNLAAESHVDRSIDAPSDFIDTNIVGTFGLLEETRHYLAATADTRKDSFRFLHVSTDEVFGSLGPGGFFNESTLYDPRSPYSASKAASDHLVRAWGHTYGIPFLVTNCSNNYGPRQYPEKLIPLMIQKALVGESLPVYGDGCNIRDWLYVEDHCSAIETVLHTGEPGETYCIGGNCERTNLQVVYAVCDVLDSIRPLVSGESRRGLVTFVTDRPGHDRRYAIDSTKIRHELGWLPSVSFEQGLEKTVRWYIGNSEWITAVTEGSGMERLGLGKANMEAGV